MKMQVTAIARRGKGRWWVVTVPEVDGALTQARTLTEVPGQAADAVATILDISADNVQVTVRPVLAREVSEPLGRAERLRRRSAEANTAAAQAVREAVARMMATDFTLTDIGVCLGVSVQRAHQLVEDVRHSPAA